MEPSRRRCFASAAAGALSSCVPLTHPQSSRAASASSHPEPMHCRSSNSSSKTSSTRCGRCRTAARWRAIFRSSPASIPSRSASSSSMPMATSRPAGDADTPFSIQSISKVFTLTLALGKVGNRLWERVGREPSGSPFNSIVQLEREQGIPRNPFINAGAIAVTDVILSGHQPREALGEILRFVRFLADDDTIIDRRGGGRFRAAHRLSQRRACQLHEVVRRAGESRSTTRSASTSTTAPSPCHAGNLRWPGGSWRNIGSQPSHGSACGDRRAGAAHQRADADLRALRRLGGVRVSRRAAGQERRRRRHPGHRAGEGIRSRCGRRGSMPRAIRSSVSSRSSASASGWSGPSSGRDAPLAERDAHMAPREDISGNARFSAPRTLRLLRRLRHRDTSSCRTRRVPGTRPARCAKWTAVTMTSVFAITQREAHGRRRGTCRSSPWGDAVQRSFLFSSCSGVAAFPAPRHRRADHLMLCRRIRFKTSPLHN